MRTVAETLLGDCEITVQVKSDFIGEQPQVDFMSVSAHWKQKKSIHIDFIASNGPQVPQV